MARRGRHPPTPEADESPQWHMGAPMMPDHAKELARVVALWSRLEQMMNGVICQLSGIGLNLGDVFFRSISMPAGAPRGVIYSGRVPIPRSAR
jgi:hypothetical protein